MTFKLTLLKSIKLNTTWVKVPKEGKKRTIKVTADQASQIILAQAGVLCDPDDEDRLTEALQSKNQPLMVHKDQSKEDAKYDLMEELTEVDKVTSEMALEMIEAGIESVEDLASRDAEELLPLDGVGPATAEAILKSAKQQK